jgi:uncharacterized protein YlxW (UPF0749 family)
VTAPHRPMSSGSKASVALVAGLLGVLVVAQLNAQQAVPGLSNLSATDLTQLIANLTTGNDQLRTEIADLTTQEAKLSAAHDRGETTTGELNGDLDRIRAWAGLIPVTGPGISITVQGPIGGDGIQQLLNELRNAGAEAIAVDGVRVVNGSVVAGEPGGLSIENDALGNAFEIRAIGSPQILTGTLTRTGGVIAQIGATYPSVQLTVTPLETMVLPATERSLDLTDGKPSL